MMSGSNVKLRAAGKRLLTIFAVLWGAATLTFIAVKLIPGDPVAILMGSANSVVDDSFRETLTRQFGLDKPLWLQYLRYCGEALTGNLGQSYQYRLPVAQVIGGALQETVPLAVSALTLALLLAVSNALLTAGRNPRLRNLLAGLELMLLSTPVYWIGIVLLSLFSFSLQWFPVTGNDGWMSLVLPVVTLSLPLAAMLSQVLRDGLEEALSQPFAVTVRTRGVSETRLRLRHALRHASLAVSTLTGTLLASVLGGSILTETVFGRAGLGQVTLSAIENRDMPLVLGVVMFSALLFVVINLLIDALYLLIDPRLRTRSHADE
ncbi:ABC transporter permease [Kosakonia oryzendophytica]|uniref:ABC transporter permease n=1 Tax=Kosakonia TaxID=1330547 RepID=UPI000777A22E|nr:ABC transporter permease [Kosakonia oryzendophytica]AMO49333.1 Peptide ABC transporter, permease protein [Enterobacter sp. FY-07]WBT56208.1 ABC transporter permease [Kosakonia oryzendophytica]